MLFSEGTEDSQNETQYVTSVWGSDDDSSKCDLSGLTSMREEPQSTSTPYQRPRDIELRDLSTPHQFISTPGT